MVASASSAPAVARRVLLVDGTNLTARAFHGFRRPPLPQLGPLVLGMLKDAAMALEATHLIVATDAAGPTFRHDLTPTYKAKRSADPEGVTTQHMLRAVRPALAAAGVAMVECPGFEADDCLATLATRLLAHGTPIVLSGDKDLQALVASGVAVYGFSGMPGARGLDRYLAVTPATVLARYGVTAAQLPDWKALAGESGDNIAGVPGLGPKRAQEIIALHGSLDAALAAAPMAAAGTVTARLAGQAEAAALGRVLATLRLDAPVPPLAPAACRVALIGWQSTAVADVVATLTAESHAVAIPVASVAMPVASVAVPPPSVADAQPSLFGDEGPWVDAPAAVAGSRRRRLSRG